ncbi:MAG: hypothetical protein FJ194_09265 [Gammaproteobacteria bacterium]|nr:hypothetical protein [Gammaproteobacteria bacterium]
MNSVAKVPVAVRPTGTIRGLIWLCLVGLAACQSPPPPPVTEARPATKTVAPTPPAITVESREIRIRTLLEQANRAIRYEHLTGPQPGSAQDLFRQVLLLDPHNDEGLRGPEKIAERFVAKALEASNRWALTEARANLARAREIMPNHPSIAPTETQVNLLAAAKRKHQRFDSTTLNDGSAATISALATLGAQAKTEGCRTTITAPNDEAGRWMFKKMNEVDMGGRVRANIRIGSPPSVELVCFPAAQ